MMNTDMNFILIILGSVVILLLVVVIALLLSLLKKQKEIVELCKISSTNTRMIVAQTMNKLDNHGAQAVSNKKQKSGTIICKKCYTPIEATSTTCSFCKTVVGRR